MLSDGIFSLAICLLCNFDAIMEISGAWVMPNFSVLCWHHGLFAARNCGYFAQRERQCLRIMQGMMLKKSTTKKSRRFWVHKMLRKGTDHGDFYHLVRELQPNAHASRVVQDVCRASAGFRTSATKVNRFLKIPVGCSSTMISPLLINNFGCFLAV